MINLEKFGIPVIDTKTYLGRTDIKYNIEGPCLMGSYLTVEELIELMKDYQKYYPDATRFTYQEQQPIESE